MTDRNYGVNCEARKALDTGLGDLYDDLRDAGLHDAASSVSYAEDCIASAIEDLWIALNPSNATVLRALIDYVEDATDFGVRLPANTPKSAVIALLEQLLAEEEGKHKKRLFK